MLHDLSKHQHKEERRGKNARRYGQRNKILKKGFREVLDEPKRDLEIKFEES